MNRLTMLADCVADGDRRPGEPPALGFDAPIEGWGPLGVGLEVGDGPGPGQGLESPWGVPAILDHGLLDDDLDDYPDDDDDEDDEDEQDDNLLDDDDEEDEGFD